MLYFEFFWLIGEVNEWDFGENWERKLNYGVVRVLVVEIAVGVYEDEVGDDWDVDDENEENGLGK